MKKYIAPLSLAVLLLTGCGSSTEAAEPTEEELRAEAIESIVAAIPTQTPPAVEPAAPETTEAAPPAPAPTTEAPVAEAPPAEVLAVEAAQMLLDYEGNEAAADLKYNGKTLEVTGKVAAVDTQFFDKEKYSVQMDDGTDYGFLRVSCNDVTADQAALIVPESVITVRGTFSDGGNLGVQIDDCVVL